MIMIIRMNANAHCSIHTAHIEHHVVRTRSVSVCSEFWRRRRRWRQTKATCHIQFRRFFHWSLRVWSVQCDNKLIATSPTTDEWDAQSKSQVEIRNGKQSKNGFLAFHTQYELSGLHLFPSSLDYFASQHLLTQLFTTTNPSHHSICWVYADVRGDDDVECCYSLFVWHSD